MYGTLAWFDNRHPPLLETENSGCSSTRCHGHVVIATTSCHHLSHVYAYLGKVMQAEYTRGLWVLKYTRAGDERLVVPRKWGFAIRSDCWCFMEDQGNKVSPYGEIVSVRWRSMETRFCHAERLLVFDEDPWKQGFAIGRGCWCKGGTLGVEFLYCQFLFQWKGLDMNVEMCWQGWTLNCWLFQVDAGQDD